MATQEEVFGCMADMTGTFATNSEGGPVMVYAGWEAMPHGEPLINDDGLQLFHFEHGFDTWMPPSEVTVLEDDKLEVTLMQAWEMGLPLPDEARAQLGEPPLAEAMQRDHVEDMQARTVISEDGAATIPPAIPIT